MFAIYDLPIMNIIYYYLICLIIFLIIYLIGAFAQLVLKIDMYNKDCNYKIFLKLTIGMFIVVMSYSIFITRGITISWLYFFIPLIIFKYKGNSKFYNVQNIINFDRRSALEILLILTILFITSAYSISNNLFDISFIPYDPDRVILADTAKFMNFTGVETFQLNYIYPELTSPNPYHYFDMWFNAFIASIFKINFTYSSQLIEAPLIGIITYIGLRSIGEKILSNKLIIIILCINTLFFNNIIKFSLSDGIPLLAYVYDYYYLTVFDYTKFFTTYLLLIWFVLGVIYNSDRISFCSLILLPITNIMMAPVVMGAMIILGIMNQYNVRKYLLKLIISLTLVACFYMLFQKNNPRDFTFTLEFLIQSVLTIEFLHSFSRKIIGSSILVLYLIIPYLLILLYYKKLAINIFKNNKYKEIFYFFFLFNCAGMISWGILSSELEAHQIYERISSVTLNLIIFITLLYLFKYSKSLKLIVALIFVVGISQSLIKYHTNKKNNIKRYDTLYLEKIKNHQFELNSVGLYFLHKEKYVGLRSILARMGEYTSTLDINTFPVNASIFDFELNSIKKQKDKEIRLMSSLPFYKFISDEKSKNEFADYDTSYYKFARKYNVNYIITDSEVTLPLIFKKYIKHHFHDEYSNENFYILVDF